MFDPQRVKDECVAWIRKFFDENGSPYFEMIKTTDQWIVLGEIALMYFVLPALIAWGVSELMRKLKWIKPGDMRLDA